MAYTINIEISTCESIYREKLSQFSNNFMTGTYTDHYLANYDFGNEDELDTLIQTFLDKYKWAVFTYFTTYQHKHIIFVTNKKLIFEQYLMNMEKIEKKYFHIYTNKYTQTKDFETITFYDDNKEGEDIFNVSKMLDKENSYLVCYFGFDIEYYRYDDDTCKYEDFVWYEDSVKLLNERSRWFDKFGEYVIYEITDELAYLDIMSMVSTDLSIVDCVISGKSDLEIIVKIIKEYRYDALFYLKTEKNISWISYYIYGGGSDEYLLLFHANEAKYTDKLSNILDKDILISRY